MSRAAAWKWAWRVLLTVAIITEIGAAYRQGRRAGFQEAIDILQEPIDADLARVSPREPTP